MTDKTDHTRLKHLNEVLKGDKSFLQWVATALLALVVFLLVCLYISKINKTTNTVTVTTILSLDEIQHDGPQQDIYMQLIWRCDNVQTYNMGKGKVIAETASYQAKWSDFVVINADCPVREHPMFLEKKKFHKETDSTPYPFYDGVGEEI